MVNAAAYTNVDRAETETSLAFAANAHGPFVLGVACADAQLPLLHISTDYVFDGTKARSYRESDPINPINAYGRSKAAGEAAVRQVHPRHGILRTSWQLLPVYDKPMIYYPLSSLMLAGNHGNPDHHDPRRISRRSRISLAPAPSGGCNSTAPSKSVRTGSPRPS